MGVSLDSARDPELVERAPRPGRTNFFGEWWNGYTRVSETRERKLVQVRILSRRPIWLGGARGFAPALRAAHLRTTESCSVSASSSKQFRRSASQAGNAGASPVEATNFAV